MKTGRANGDEEAKEPREWDAVVIMAPYVLIMQVPIVVKSVSIHQAALRMPANQVLQRLRSCKGILLIELMVSLGLIGLVVTGAIVGLLTSNRMAAVNRAMTGARMVVERNIETALNAPYTATVLPAILQTTTTTGVTWDDDGGGDNLVNILVQDSAGTNNFLKGTLTRIVTVEANPQNAPIRRITFRVSFIVRGNTHTSEMTTLRAIDDF